MNRSSAPPGSQLVLVVDGDASLAADAAEIFARRGFATRLANDGESALEAARERFDLAIVDITLPDGSGLEIATRLERLDPQAEIVLTMHQDSIDSAIPAVRGGMYRYVQKPFDPDALLALGTHALSEVQLRRDRQRLERELRETGALYRGVVDTVDSFIAGLGPDGKVRMWNRCAARATGFESDRVLGRPLAELLVSDHARRRLDEALKHVKEGRVMADLELTLNTASGEPRLLRWNLCRFERAGEPSDLILAVGEDLTDRLELERRAAEAEALASLGTLTTGLAHEIRNPLNAASLQLELLRRSAERLTDSALRNGIETRVGIVREELSRLTNLLDDFLSLAKPRALSLVPVELCALVDEVIELEQPAANRAGVRIESGGDEPHMSALADQHSLKQVLVNLIVNAIDAMRSRGHGRVVVRCHYLSEQRVELSVEDDGPGIAPEIADRVLSPFVTTKEAGTGLGLTIVKRIVDRHGGTLSFNSAPGRGTTVHVILTRPRPSS